jgi:hypothetical protein
LSASFERAAWQDGGSSGCIDTGSRWSVFGGYLLGSMLMLAAGLISARFGVAISLPAIGFNVLALAIWRVGRPGGVRYRPRPAVAIRWN